MSDRAVLYPIERLFVSAAASLVMGHDSGARVALEKRVAAVLAGIDAADLETQRQIIDGPLTEMIGVARDYIAERRAPAPRDGAVLIRLRATMRRLMLLYFVDRTAQSAAGAGVVFPEETESSACVVSGLGRSA